MSRFTYAPTQKWSRGLTLRLIIGAAAALWLVGGLILFLSLA